ncbi:DUF2935 domain-containing protein [Ammoniphilus sp. CFH 90114]|uniref:DUF2935 domain-containing protein n=1 Tax=Ammoniphilus sp. CFH 90114 TaxID=2493665 RepID=UPI00100E9403|nr:DUF2935 domain-containing protein [Ammoniphilus sp. CFH 90114]RXT05249.1 DUF2935 domain-containing protein [Ammoniphilus sp. CFH 90114]
MGTANFQQAALFEHRFWLQVLGDHARMLLDQLSPKEQEEVKKAQNFIQVFDQLLIQARQNLAEKELASLTNTAKKQAEEIRGFKLHLIRRHLTEQIAIGFPPTFINHMVNEVEEYLRILDFLTKGTVPPPMHPVHHHLVWLLDAAGHSAGIAADLDMVEKKLKKQSEKFAMTFEQFYIKAVEVAGYMRTSLQHFPALDRFNHQVEVEILVFTQFLRELEAMELQQKVLSTLAPLILDHMAREECYYLTKLAEVNAARPPQCDPTKPRTEA